MGVLGGLLMAVLLFGALLGAALGWVSALRLREVAARLARLEAEIDRLRPAGGGDSEASGTRAAPAPAPGGQAPRQSDGATAADAAAAASSAPRASRRGWSGPARHAAGQVLAGIRDHWMVWLGGLSIGLAGIFLVRHSIEQGWLGPAARVLLGIVTGVVLHALAEWLRRRTQRHYDAVAALAGGASLTLYAAVLAALHLYQLWPAAVIFLLLALISLGTMLLALRHGPVLAILGILGAYAVPALLGGAADQLATVLAYSLTVALAAFLLMRYVYRPWLWWGTVAGALFWWWIALEAGAQTEPWLGLYLAILAWGMLALRSGNYRLNRPVADATPPVGWRDWLRGDGSAQAQLLKALLMLIVAQAYAISLDPLWSLGPLVWLPLPALILIASRYNEALRAFPWVALIATAAGLVASAVTWQPFGPWLGSLRPVAAEDLRVALVSLALLGLLFSAGGAWHLHARRDSALAASLAFMAPPLVLALAYVLAPDALQEWMLSAASLAVGLALGGFAAARLRAGQADAVAFWQIASAHLAYSLAVVIGLEQVTLTLALAVQVLSLTWLVQRFAVPQLGWLVKLVLMVVVVRLTLNPWLLEYGPATSWTLATYGGSLLVVWLASRLVPAQEGLRPWLQVGAVHLLLLLLHVLVRFQLHDGNVFAPAYGFTEAALNTPLWASFALLYFWRSRLGSELPELHRVLAQILMLLAVGNYLALVTVMNPLWDAASAAVIAHTPILNLLLLAYGLPVLLWALASRYYEPDLRPFFALLAGIGLWLFVSLEIRHLWHGQMDLAAPVRAGELYSYSAVWLLMAVGTMVLGILRGRSALYRGGLALLLLVILKIFFVDMAGLTGLLRAVSFMGLGLSLLGLAFLHQYLGRRRATGDRVPHEAPP
ncbi:DUF2339 domain-containing protein [Thioalkalivibrio sp.]|uniref:DUF2339 domain-containing protein n=1 Tax=Thioalkalivibrio sp. TaxID=2093813 RepID=UPI00356B1357